MTMTWQSGRQLASINKDGLSATFAYDANGHRTQKTVNGVTTNYYWVGDRLQYLAIGDDLLVFLYDDKGTPYGMFTVLDGVQQYFFYLYNAQGDVIAIIDDYAERVVNYEYSAWGELLSVTGSKADTVGVLNPFRYRGYCYDTETGLYYLNSRYYDPVTQRFLNGDGYASTGQGILGNNMFAYCLNNPVNCNDADGRMAAATGALAYGMCMGATNIWNPAGWAILAATAVVAIGICVIPWDDVGKSISKGWNKIKNIAKSASISLSISKAVSKAKAKIRKERNKYDYWIASYVEYGNGRGTYIPTTAISYSRAIKYVRSGGSVFADSKSNAYRLAKAVGYGRAPTRPERHQSSNGSTLGYWWHYHDGMRSGGHIFYV